MQADTLLLPYALCSPEDVGRIIQGGSVPSGNQLEEITHLINAFTELVQGANFLNRELARKARTEYFDVDDGWNKPLVSHDDWVQVKAPPISVGAQDPPVPVVQVWNSSDRVYNGSSLLTLYTDYTVNAERGIIQSNGCWASGPRSIKITYTGGLVDPPADEHGRPTGPPDLRSAAAMQVAAWYQRKKDMNVESMGFPQGGSIQLADPSKLITSVRQTIHKYKIFRGVS